MTEAFKVDSRIRAALPTMDAPFFQAGLAGYSDAAMRIIARRHGAPYCITEALLDRILLAGGKGLAKADLDVLADNVPGGRRSITAEVKKQPDGTWKVTRFAVEAVGSC